MQAYVMYRCGHFSIDPVHSSSNCIKSPDLCPRCKQRYLAKAAKSARHRLDELCLPTIVGDCDEEISRAEDIRTAFFEFSCHVGALAETKKFERAIDVLLRKSTAEAWLLIEDMDFDKILSLL